MIQSRNVLQDSMFQGLRQIPLTHAGGLGSTPGAGRKKMVVGPCYETG